MEEKLDIVNMKEASQKAEECGVHLSEYTLRRAIRSGQLPCRIVGRTYLISWRNLVRWLNCEDNSESSTAEKE